MKIQRFEPPPHRKLRWAVLIAAFLAAAVCLPLASKSEQLARGAYLACAGNCGACHTERGGAAYAGGRAVPSPFGTIYAPKITPDAETGIGKWSADAFWQAMHNGKSADGSLLYPAFPYPNYTKLSRADVDAVYAFLRSVLAVRRANTPNTLRFPYNQSNLPLVWRALYFRPCVYQDERGKTMEWNRGAYLVQGAGHCSACHTARKNLGAAEEKSDLAGGLIPVLNWYAPSLTSDKEAGLGDWEIGHIAALLKTGVSPRATVFWPMAEVVYGSLQHLSDTNIRAMAIYLKSLPKNEAPPPGSAFPGAAATTPASPSTRRSPATAR